MKQFFAILIATGILLPAPAAHADIWGADVGVLVQILQNGISQLAELKSILQSGEDTFGLLSDINRGINDSLSLAETMGIRIDPGIYRELGQVDQAVRMVEDVYGAAHDSKLATIQRNTDQTVAEAISLNNEVSTYTQNLDKVGEEIKRFSHVVSPGGAAKLTAEGVGVMIHVMNEQMRTTGQALKLQAQALAIQNMRDKDQTEQYLKEGDLLKQKLVSLNPEYEVPRF